MAMTGGQDSIPEDMGLKEIKYTWVENVNLSIMDYERFFATIENKLKEKCDKTHPRLDMHRIGLFKDPEFYNLILMPDDTLRNGGEPYTRLFIELYQHSNTHEKPLKRSISDLAKDAEDIYDIIISELKNKDG